MGKRKKKDVESFNEIQNNREYLFYTAVNQGFIQSAQTKAAQTLRRLKIRVNGVASDYVVPLAPGGSEKPNHWGARGQIRGREAKELVEYYESVTRNNIDAWLLDLEGVVLWTKANGFGPYTNQVWSYEEFLAENSPSLHIVREPTVAAVG